MKRAQAISPGYAFVFAVAVSMAGETLALGQTSPIIGALRDALDKSSVVASGPNEVRLQQVITPGDPSRPGRSLVVECQIGVAGDQRIFIGVAAAEAEVEQVPGHLQLAVAELTKAGPRRLSDGTMLKPCLGRWECARACPRPGGGEFCCRWECARGK